MLDSCRRWRQTSPVRIRVERGLPGTGQPCGAGNARPSVRPSRHHAFLSCSEHRASITRSEALGLADGDREGTRLVVVGEVLLGVEAIEVSQAARHR